MAYRGGADIISAEFLYRHVAVVFGPFLGKASWIGVVRDAEGKPCPEGLELVQSRT